MKRSLLSLVLIQLTWAGCKSVECGDGTTERDGACVSANQTISDAKCGAYTELQGDICVPSIKPTLCDPTTTKEETDENGITTCVGTGASGCSVRLACPNPETGTQTICGQIYDFESGAPFAAPNADGNKCVGGETSGPCALSFAVYDAVAFATMQSGAPAIMPGEVYIDDCGRYRVSNIPTTTVTSGLLAVGLDDAVVANHGPPGLTNIVGVALAVTGTAVKDVDHFVVPASTTSQWAINGPVLSSTQGILAAVFHGHTTGTDVSSGVSFKAYSGAATVHPYYFPAASRGAIDTSLSSTGPNGTALVTISGGSLTDAYYGEGGLQAGCMWKPQPALTVPYVILVETFRPTSIPGMTCNL